MARTAITFQPKNGSGSPEGVVTSGVAGDLYIDTTNGIMYWNPVQGATTGWQIVQSAPSA